MTISKRKMRHQFESDHLVLRFYFILLYFLWVKSSKRVLAMVCDNLSKYFPIVMNFSGYLPLYEDTSAIDFEPDRSIRLAGHAPKVGHNELDLF